MAPTTDSYDAIVVGGGHNGLVCAAYLARGGLRTLVVERRERVGGALATVELAPGVRVPAHAHTVGRLAASIARELRFRDHRLRLVQPAVRAFAPALEGPGVTLWGDAARTAREAAERTAADGEGYLALDRQVRALGAVLSRLMGSLPPDPSHLTVDDALSALRLGVGLRALDTADARALGRVLPMPVADYVAELLEDEGLRAAVAYRGLLYSSLGPRSAGSTQLLLADAAGNDGGAAGQTVYARGGPGALADALAAAVRANGGRIRMGAQVVHVSRSGARATGVVLADGTELRAGVVVSDLDPKRTLLDLVDPDALGPELGWRVGNLDQAGVTAKVDLGLTEVPSFSSLGAGRGGAAGGDGEPTLRLRGRIVIAPSLEWLDRAADASKYGRISERPLLEATIPSLVDASLIDPDRAGPTRHVMSVLVQSAPYSLREGDWASERDLLADRVVATLELVAPGIGSLITARRVVTPRDIETDLGTMGGHPFHAAPGLDQWFAWRPLIGYARHRMPLDGLYLCGAGAHPGGGVTGLPGRNAARAVLADRRRATAGRMLARAAR